MAGGQGLQLHTAVALFAPQSQRIKQLVDHAALARQHQQVAGYFLPLRAALPVVVQVDAAAGAVVFAGGMQRCRSAKAAFVVGQRLRLDGAESGASPAAQLGMQIRFCGFRMVRTHHDFRQWRGLQHVKPVVVGAGKFHVGHGQAAAFVHVQRGRNVDHAELFDAVRMVQRQPVRHAPAPVVAAEVKLVNAQHLHHLRHVIGHAALAVIGVI